MQTETNIIYIVDVPALKVLIAEDDPLAQQFVKKLIGRIGLAIAVEQVTTAEEAFTRLRSESFDLVIADHFLEGHCTGLDLWRHCLANYPATGFLLTSGLDPELVQKLSMRTGASPNYLQKPFRPEAIQTVVKGLLG